MQQGPLIVQLPLKKFKKIRKRVWEFVRKPPTKIFLRKLKKHVDGKSESAYIHEWLVGIDWRARFFDSVNNSKKEKQAVVLETKIQDIAIAW